jgi:hypothetical protein
VFENYLGKRGGRIMIWIMLTILLFAAIILLAVIEIKKASTIDKDELDKLKNKK